MRVGTEGRCHLAYCTNIHPGDGWEDVFANLRRYAPTLRTALSSSAPFGLGLRLSAREAEELSRPGRLQAFVAFLADHGLYVPMVNGFVYGAFHRRPVKADAFAPDWRTEERVRYTLQLVEILKTLLPPGIDGSISTCPVSYRGWFESRDAAAWEVVVRNLVRVVTALVRVREEEGCVLHLDLEPEPGGALESTADVVDFFGRWLLPQGGAVLAEALALSPDAAADRLRDHVRVCVDTCHLAVTFDEPAQAVAALEQTGVGIGRVQVSSALRVTLPERARDRDDIARLLTAFADTTYLHQVMERRSDGLLRSYNDLCDALPYITDPEAQEWRIHFHVPLFVERYEALGSTRAQTVEALQQIMRSLDPPHLEIETYTWDVLPPGLKADLHTSIRREYEWLLAELARPASLQCPR